MASNSSQHFLQLKRSMSLNDLDAALSVREMIEKDIVLPEDATKHRHFQSSTRFSFVLPSLQSFPSGLYQLVVSKLIDEHIMKELEATRRLNWCRSVAPMVTLMTLGDGNCLMHAASLAMWAVSDRYHILRKTVYEALLEDVRGSYHQRWRCEQERLKHLLHGGYEMTAEQWDREWQVVIRLVSQMEFPSGPNGSQFGSLEEIHIFVLANVLRRTIIVVSDDTLRGPCGDSFFPINFSGIYLPLHWDPVDCVKSPLVIGYANGHFTAVVSMEDGQHDHASNSAQQGSDCVHAVPLVKQNGIALPVHFLLDHQITSADGLLRQYLDCAKVALSSNPGDQPKSPVLVARLHFPQQPSYIKDLVSGYFANARESYQHTLEGLQTGTEFPPSNLPLVSHPVKCETAACPFSGSIETANRCSQCFKEYVKNLGIQSASSGHLPNQALTEYNQHPAFASKPLSTKVLAPMVLPLQNSSLPRCQTTGCKYGALLGKSTLCERCYEAERGAEEMAAGMSRLSLATAAPCANSVNGCEFYGLQEHHDLCSKCYRTFCLQMENTLGVESPTGLPPASPVPSATPNLCQKPDCQAIGVPALYNMCVSCYKVCIRAFITSEGRSVGNLRQPCLPPSLPRDHMQTIPTAGAKKGILCVTPGCFNERDVNLNDLCKECYENKSGPLLQTSKAAVPVRFPVVHRPLCSSSSLPTAATQHHLTSALTSAIGHPAHSAWQEAGNTVTKQGPQLVRSVGWETAPSIPTFSRAPVSNAFQGTQVQPSLSSTSQIGIVTGQYSTSSPNASGNKRCVTQDCEFYGIPENGFLCSSCLKRQAVPPIAAQGHVSNQVSGSQRSILISGLCAMDGCKNLAWQDGLCRPCYQAAFERETHWVAQQAKQHARRSFAAVNQVGYGNSCQSGSISTVQGQQTVGNRGNEGSKALTGGMKPCASKGCLKFGTPDKDGLCENCFHNNRAEATLSLEHSSRVVPVTTGNLPGGRSYEPPQDQGHSTTVSYSTPGPVQVSQIQSPRARIYEASASGNMEESLKYQRCLGANCMMYGTPETNGLCSRCFLETTNSPSYPHSVPDFHPEHPSSPMNLTSGLQSV